MLDFQVTTAVLDDGTGVVGLSGEADLYTTPRFARDLGGLVADGIRRIIVDLTGATFVDCTLLATLARYSKRMDARGGKLAIVVDDQRIQRIFAITGLDRELKLERSVAAAIAGVADRLTDAATAEGEERELTVHVEREHRPAPGAHYIPPRSRAVTAHGGRVQLGPCAR